VADERSADPRSAGRRPKRTPGAGAPRPDGDPAADQVEHQVEQADDRADAQTPDASSLARDPTRPVAEALGLTPASDVARAALNRAKAAARARGTEPGRPVARRATGQTRSGPRPDGRDPVLVGDTLARIAAERGWSDELSVGGVIGRWREVVGEEVADHCVPESFEEGRLVVRADSTTWAANLRLLTPQLLARLEKELGPDVVRDVAVLGPSGPRWAKGRRSVPGRGPRDTYG
jgi:predicted nucleic acid-binding Zn ribbon protein